MSKENLYVVCPVCNSSDFVCWNSDADFEEVGADGEGIVSFYECQRCKTWMEFYITAGEIDE